VWLIDPETRTIAEYAAPDQLTRFHQDQMLDGGEVIPGVTVSLRELFAALDLQGQG